MELKQEVDGIVFTFEGMEKQSEYEINQLLKKNVKTGKQELIFKSNIEELVKLCYLGRTITKVCVLLHKFYSKDIIHDLGNELNQVNLGDFSLNGKTFRVNCARKGEHNFSSSDVCNKVGEHFFKNYKVDLTNPEFIIFVFISGDECTICLDISGIDLSKREYKIFSHAASLNGAIASAFLTYLKITKKEVIVDPFCGSGTIPIEAALILQNKSVHFYSKEKFAFQKLIDMDLAEYDKIDENKFKLFGYDFLLNCVTSSRKNAKIAGVDKNITLSKVEVEWLDTKLKEGEVDLIITQPPILSNMDNNKKESLFKDFFYQAENILKKSGKICMFLESDELLVFKRKFIISEEFNVMQGNKKMHVVILNNQKKV